MLDQHPLSYLMMTRIYCGDLKPDITWNELYHQSLPFWFAMWGDEEYSENIYNIKWLKEVLKREPDDIWELEHLDSYGKMSLRDYFIVYKFKHLLRKCLDDDMKLSLFKECRGKSTNLPYIVHQELRDCRKDFLKDLHTVIDQLYVNEFMIHVEMCRIRQFPDLSLISNSNHPFIFWIFVAKRIFDLHSSKITWKHLLKHSVYIWKKYKSSEHLRFLALIEAKRHETLQTKLELPQVRGGVENNFRLFAEFSRQDYHIVKYVFRGMIDEWKTLSSDSEDSLLKLNDEELTTALMHRFCSPVGQTVT